MCASLKCDAQRYPAMPGGHKESLLCSRSDKQTARTPLEGAAGYVDSDGAVVSSDGRSSIEHPAGGIAGLPVCSGEGPVTGVFYCSYLRYQSTEGGAMHGVFLQEAASSSSSPGIVCDV